MTRTILAVTILTLAATAGRAERVEAAYAIPGVPPGTNLEAEYKSAGRPHVPGCGLTAPEWQALLRTAKITVREVGPGAHEIVLDGDLPRLPADQLLHAVARAHQVHLLEILRAERQAGMKDIETRARDARLSQERARESIAGLRRCVEGVVDLRHALEASSHRVEDHRSEVVAIRIELAVTDARVAAVRERLRDAVAKLGRLEGDVERHGRLLEAHLEDLVTSERAPVTGEPRRVDEPSRR